MQFSQLLGALALVSLAGPIVAQDTWTELKAPHVRVVTNGTAEQARAIAADFERMRTAVGWRMPGIDLDLDGPLTVYAARDEKSLDQLHPSWEDPELFNFYGNWERDVAFVDLSTWGKVEQHPVFLGYVHEILRRDSWPLPVWLDRGYTQLLGSARFQGKATVVGAPSQRWVSLLRSPRIDPVEKIIQKPPLLGFLSGTVEQERQQQVNEAWALAHFLSFGPHMQSGALLLSFYRRLQVGEDPATAFRAIFGDPAQLNPAFLAYIHGKTLGGIAAEIAPVDLSNAPTQTLSAVQMQDELGQIEVSTRNLAAGRKQFEKALAADPHDAIAHEELGILEYQDGHLAEAREHWTAAVSADQTRYVARLALVITGTPARAQSPEQRQATLQELQAIERIRPQFSPAFVREAVLHWWMGDLPAALKSCSEAERLSPARSDYHLLHAELLVAQGQPKEAAALLQQQFAAFQAESQPEVQSFNNVLLWQSLPAEARGNTSYPVQIPAGQKLVVGHLSAVECKRSTGFNIKIQPADGSGELRLFSESPQVLFSDTTWIGGGHDPLCHASAGQPAYALYKPGSKGYGVIERMEVLDDTPAIPSP